MSKEAFLWNSSVNKCKWNNWTFILYDRFHLAEDPNICGISQAYLKQMLLIDQKQLKLQMSSTQKTEQGCLMGHLI